VGEEVSSMRSGRRFKSVGGVSGAVFQTLEQRTLLSGSSITFGPDPSFGDGGVVTQSPSASGDAMVALANGDTLVAETVPSPVFPDQVVLQRYLPDGNLDPSFGTSGSAVVANNQSVGGLTRDSSGRILLLTSALNPDSTVQASETFIARFSSNGTADESYGSGGSVSASLPNLPDISVTQFAVDAKARALLLLTVFPAGATEYTSDIVRYTAQGQPDPSFGKDGIVATGFYAASLSFQPNGKVLVGTSANQPALTRYNANGSLDKSFGHRGTALVTLPEQIVLEAAVGDITVLSNGSIAIAGQENDQMGFRPYPDERLFVAEFSAKGTPVKSFGSDGATVTVVDPSTPAGGKQIAPSLITPEADGSLIVSGNYFPHIGGDNGARSNVEIMVAAYNAHGSLNETFGDAGIALAQVPGNTNTYGILTSDPSFAGGKITVAWDTGFVGNGAGFDLFRYDLTATATVSGTVFSDLNRDGIREKREPSLAGAFVYEDATNVGYYVVGDPTATSDANGNFKLTSLDPGTYFIRINPAAGLHRTRPSAKSGLVVHLSGDSVVGGLLFGEAKTK
jgi:uncharacterized delta-60 repeat protein